MDDPKEITNTASNGDEFSELMKEYDLKTVNFDAPVEGHIVEILNDRVVIDIGRKTEGVLDRSEIENWDGELQYKIGDAITVICKNVNRKQGYIAVSKKELDKRKGWMDIQKAFEAGTPVKGRVMKVVGENKGFSVDMGAEMFLPMSQVDIRRVKNPESFLGQELEFRITRLNNKDKSGVVSRRVLMEEERDSKLKEVFEHLKEGEIVKGTVSSIMDYGAFVNIGGIDGLVHRENISYGRIGHPREKLKKGEEIEVKILAIDQEKQKISLGIKQKTEDPWMTIGSKYPVGHKLVARVTKLVEFGAFIELEEGVEGLLHISDLTWEGKPQKVDEYVAVGDELWVQVIELNEEERKIKLGLKQLELRPEERFIKEHNVGDIIKVKVKKILNARVFVEIEKNIEGVIKISDIMYFRIDSPKEYLKEGETIDAMIISDELDQNYKVRLGLKQLTDKEWNEFFSAHRPGDIIEVAVKRVSDKGVSVEVSKSIEGFVKLSEISEERIDAENIEEHVKSGEKREALIMNVYSDKKRVYLSFKAVGRKKEREEIEKYATSTNETVTTIGDLFQSAIDNNK